MDIRYGESCISQIGEDSRLVDTADLSSSNDPLEGKSDRANAKQCIDALSSTPQGDWSASAIPSDSIGRGDKNILRQYSNSFGVEDSSHRECRTSRVSRWDSWETADYEIRIANIADVGNRNTDVGFASDCFRGSGRVEIGSAKVDRRSTVDGQVDRRSETVKETFGGSDVNTSISEHWSRELSHTVNVKAIDLCQQSILGNSLVDSETLSANVTGPEEAGTSLAVKRGCGSMTDTKDTCVGTGGIGNLGERWNTSTAGELEDVSRITDDTDVDVSTFQRIDTCSSINRILVLVYLNNIVQLVWSVLVSSQVIQIQPVGLSTLSSNDTNTFDISAREFAWEELERTGSEIFVCTIQLRLFPGHEEVDDTQTSICVDSHVNSSFFEGRGWVAAVDRNGAELRSITVSSSEEHGSSIIRGQSTSRHPDTSPLGLGIDTSTFRGVSLNNCTRRLVPSHDPSGEIPLNAVRSEPSVDVLPRVKQSRTLVVNTSAEASNRVIAGNNSL